MTAFVCFCTLLLGANHLFAVNAQSVEDEILYGSRKSTIAGGDVISITKVPYIAQLIKNEGVMQMCGLTIISPKWLLTAAHCVIGVDGTFSIRIGSADSGMGENRPKIVDVIPHEEYNDDTLDNDIALIEVKDPIKFNSMQKSIPISKKIPTAGELVTISGFGRTTNEENSYSKVLRSTVVPVIPKSECVKAFQTLKKEKITDNMFCARVPGKKDACRADSGGPAVIDGKLAGIVSFGYGCPSDEKSPGGVYTQVANYINWIQKNTGLKL